MKLVFATRPSPLARWQTNHVIQKLQEVWTDLDCEVIVITTRGDRVIDKPLPEIGGKGLFTYELEQALRAGRVQAAVHSLKDLPTEDPPGLMVGVVPERADARDALVCPAGHTLDELPPGAVVGTSSIRRRAQLLARRPDLKIEPIRGNVDTRLRKVVAGQYDAIVLAIAGVARLGFEERITQRLSLDVMLPAPGQGALAVQCRSEDEGTRKVLGAIHHPATRLAVTAERAFLSALGGGCSLPVGAHGTCEGTRVTLRGVVAAPAGERVIRLRAQGAEPHALGAELADQALRLGARSLIHAISRQVSS